MVDGEGRRGALAALVLKDPGAKVIAVRQLAAATATFDPVAMLDEPPGVPGRPPRPLLVAPSGLARRDPGSHAGRAALLHALAHIEFNAINLALDAVWRFPAMPVDYYADWVRIAGEEALHFELLCERLAALGLSYGDLPAHDGLWAIAERTRGDVLARMALVPRTLEARGLDASPAVRAKLANAGDATSASVVDVILSDEIGHVAVGNHWYQWLCDLRSLPAARTYRELVMQFHGPRPGSMNLGARLAAGFSQEELDSWSEPWE